MRELLDVRAVHHQRRHDDLLRCGNERSIAAQRLRHPHDRLIAELERLLHDRGVNRAVFDAGQRLVGLVEGDDLHAADLAGLAHGVENRRAVVAPQPDEALDVRISHQRVGRVRLRPHVVHIVGAHVDDADVRAGERSLIPWMRSCALRASSLPTNSMIGPPRGCASRMSCPAWRPAATLSVPM